MNPDPIPPMNETILEFKRQMFVKNLFQKCEVKQEPVKVDPLIICLRFNNCGPVFQRPTQEAMAKKRKIVGVLENVTCENF